MTDNEVERLIWGEIKRKQIIFEDMVGLFNHGVDPTPKAGEEGQRKRIRSNRFNENFGSGRMREILSVEEYSPYDVDPPLKISFNDLFRFWWNRCAVKEEVVDDVLEDIFEFLKEQMKPPIKEEPEMDMTVNFEEVRVDYPEPE